MSNTRATTLSILFADISGSVAMYSSLGDATASRVVTEALWLMAEAAGQHGGDVVETRGDEVLCTFPTPAQAMAAGVDMQRAMAEQLPSRNADTPAGFGLHVGIHHGGVIIEDGQLFGDAVNRAARVRSLAKRGQVLVSADAREGLAPDDQHSLRFHDEVVLRGQSTPETVYEVLWQTDATMIGLRPTQVREKRKAHRRSVRLHLRCGPIAATVGGRQPVVILGRGEAADLTISDDMASREHVRVEQRRGRFYLADFSTNGTYVECDGKAHFVHRDELQLSGTGRFSLGRELEAARHPVTFEHKTKAPD